MIFLTGRQMRRRRCHARRVEDTGWRHMSWNSDGNVMSLGVSLVVQNGVGIGTAQRRRGIVLVSGESDHFRAGEDVFIETRQRGSSVVLNDLFQGSHLVRGEQAETAIIV